MAMMNCSFGWDPSSIRKWSYKVKSCPPYHKWPTCYLMSHSGATMSPNHWFPPSPSSLFRLFFLVGGHRYGTVGVQDHLDAAHHGHQKKEAEEEEEEQRKPQIHVHLQPGYRECGLVHPHPPQDLSAEAQETLEVLCKRELETFGSSLVNNNVQKNPTPTQRKIHQFSLSPSCFPTLVLVFVCTFVASLLPQPLFLWSCPGRPSQFHLTTPGVLSLAQFLPLG